MKKNNGHFCLRATASVWTQTVVLAAASALSHPVWAANEQAIKTLADQAKFWDSKGRADLAVAAWQRLLLIDPANTEALLAAMQFEVNNKRPDAAKALYEKLRKSPGVSATDLQKANATLATKPAESELLEKARIAARAGDLKRSVDFYGQYFRGQPPKGILAVEYYLTMSGLPDKWDEAREGLAVVEKADPDNAKISVAYAELLTYRSTTIKEGVEKLIKLAGQPEVSTQVIGALRKALTWLPADPADIHLYQGYLKYRPTDELIIDRVKRLTQETVRRSSVAETGRHVARPNNNLANVKPDPKSIALGEGYAALSTGKLDAAEAAFKGLLAMVPRSPDALGGLGLVRLRQERLAEAQSFFTEANKNSGGKSWGQALDSVRFWMALEAGDKARAAGDLGAAKRNYEAAAKLDDRHERPIYSLANVLADEGRVADAEKVYRKLLEENPDSLDVKRGFALFLISQNKIESALDLTKSLSDEDKLAIGYEQLLSRRYQSQADSAIAAGDTFKAMQLLEDALLLDSGNPWLRLKLARLYQTAGATREASGLMTSLLQTQPDSPEVLHAAALMSAGAMEWATGLKQLEKIPAASRTAAMVDLQRNLWANAQVENAKSLAKAAQGAQASKVLQKTLASLGPSDNSLRMVVAMGMIELGDDKAALDLVRNLLKDKNNTDLGLRIQYAGILARARQDVELVALLRTLYQQPLTADQRTEVDSIRVSYSTRQIDVQREAGNLSYAYEIAMQILRDSPADAAAQEALARLYSAAGEHSLALSWYHQLLQKSPNNLSLLVAAGSAAMQAGELEYSQSALDKAQQLAPSDPNVLSSLGRLARVQGKTKQAMEYLERAQAVTLNRLADEGAGKLSINLIDYPTPGGSGQVERKSNEASPIPLIPNPLGRLGKQTPQDAGFGLPLPIAPAGQPSTAPFLPQPKKDKNPSPLFPADQPALRPVQYRPSVQDTGANVLSDFQMESDGADRRFRVLTQGTLDYPRQPVRESSPPFTAELPEKLLAPSGWRVAETMRSQDERTLPSKLLTTPLQREIDDLRSQTSPKVAAGSSWQGRNGESGTSELNKFSHVIEGRFARSDTDRLVLRLEPVFLTAGSVSSSSNVASQLFGTNALVNVGGNTGTTSKQQDSGLGFSVGYETQKLKLDVGSTPFGFRVRNAVGGIDFNESLGDVKLNLTLSRRPVTDSLLSYAGALDENTGQIWGGVVSTGGRMQASTEAGPIGIYGYGGLHSITGKNVAKNSSFELGTGLFYKFVQQSDFQVVSGVNLTFMGYKRNLRYFTLGHGGYFSPQRYLALGVPLEVSGRTGRLSYKFDGSVSVQNVKENSTVYFPGDAALQDSWESVAKISNAVASSGAVWNTYYPGQSKTGIGFRVGAEAEYLLSTQWAIGGQFSVDKSSDFNMSNGLVYLKYHFDPVRSGVEFPPRVLKVGQ